MQSINHPLFFKLAHRILTRAVALDKAKPFLCHQSILTT